MRLCLLLALLLLSAGCTSRGAEAPEVSPPSGFLDVAVAPPYLYATSERGVFIYNLSTLELLGAFETEGQAEGVAPLGNLLLVCDGLSGMLVLDVSYPHEPKAVYRLSYPGNFKQVRLLGEEAYVANFDDINGLVVLNLSRLPILSISGTFDPPGYEHVRDLVVRGRYVYLADFTGGMVVVDRRNLSLVSVYPAEGVTYSVDVSGGVAVLAKSDSGVEILNITSPASPEPLSRVQVGGYAIRVRVAGDAAFVSTGTDGVYILNISTPEAPEVVSRIQTQGNAFGFALHGDRLYIADYTSLLVYNVSSLSSPVLLRSVPYPYG